MTTDSHPTDDERFARWIVDEERRYWDRMNRMMLDAQKGPEVGAEYAHLLTDRIGTRESSLDTVDEG